VARGELTCGRAGRFHCPMGDEELSAERKSWSTAGHIGRLVGGCFDLVLVADPMHLRLIVETRRQGYLIMRSRNPRFQRAGAIAPPLSPPARYPQEPARAEDVHGQLTRW